MAVNEESLDFELGSYEDRFLACRDLRHAWSATGYFRGAYGGVRRRLTCSRCGTWREDRWEGGVVRRTYEYPEGYRVPGRMHAVDVRDEILRRVHVYASQASMLAAVTRKGAANGKKRQHNVIDLRDQRATRAGARKTPR